MSTIASPRDPSAPLARRMNPSQATVTTPTSSTRPSLDIAPSSTSSSPNPGNAHAFPGGGPGPNKRANRAALREYYNLKEAAAAAHASGTSTPGTPTVEVTADSLHSDYSGAHNSSTAPSELDHPDFDAAAYVSRAIASSTLSELLRTYARVLGEIRALDAEKKALVYDNYSKLISATETIRRMQSTMDPLNPMAGTLDLVVAKIYEQANGLREGLRKEVPPPPGKVDGAGKEKGKEEETNLDRRKRTRELAREVLEVPGRLRGLMEEGREEEARKEWEMPRRLLERWREKGLGGPQVDALIEEGDAIVRNDESDSGSGSESGQSASTT